MSSLAHVIRSFPNHILIIATRPVFIRLLAEIGQGQAVAPISQLSKPRPGEGTCVSEDAQLLVSRWDGLLGSVRLRARGLLVSVASPRCTERRL